MCGPPVQPTEIREILNARQFQKVRRKLEGDSDLFEVIRPPVLETPVEHRHGSLILPEQADQNFLSGRLTCSTRTQETEDFAPGLFRRSGR
jgi:hypothetical protein